MCDDLIPFWEKAYREDGTVAFSDQPNATVTEFEPLLARPSSVLDVGCGEGQNAIYLARQGIGLTRLICPNTGSQS